MFQLYQTNAMTKYVSRIPAANRHKSHAKFGADTIYAVLGHSSDDHDDGDDDKVSSQMCCLVMIASRKTVRPRMIILRAWTVEVVVPANSHGRLKHRSMGPPRDSRNSQAIKRAIVNNIVAVIIILLWYHSAGASRVVLAGKWNSALLFHGFLVFHLFPFVVRCPIVECWWRTVEKPSARIGDLWCSVRRALEKTYLYTVELLPSGLGGLSILKLLWNGVKLDWWLFECFTNT